MNNTISFSDFEKAFNFNKVKKGKKKLSDRKYIKFSSLESKDLNSLGRFFIIQTQV